MLSDDRRDEHPDVGEVRDIHALTPPPQPQPQPPPVRGRLGELWDTSSAATGRSSAPSLGGGGEVENFSTMSGEFSALVVAGSTMRSDDDHNNVTRTNSDLGRIGEEEEEEETNPLAIVPDPANPIASPRRGRIGTAAPEPSASADHSSGGGGGGGILAAAGGGEGVSVYAVKKEEVESKIGAWQTAEIAKINNRFKREDVVINGWESEQLEKANATLKKIERKLDEKRARAVEKMQNEVARARRKAEEKRASAEAKRGTKVAKVLELSNLLRAVGRAPSKRSIF